MISARDFIWFTVRNRATGAPHSEGYWSDVGTVAAQVASPVAGTVLRTFEGAGGLISIAPIAATTALTVQQTEVRLSQIDDRINDLIRGYDPRFGAVEVYRGDFDPDTGAMTGPAECVFFGFVNDLRVETPEEGGEGAVVATCVTATQEITRASAATRSDADQRRRSASDNFFQDVSTVGELEIFWGARKA